MSDAQLTNHIEKKKSERKKHLAFLLYLDELKPYLDNKALSTIKAVLNSKVAQCDRSIRDHTNLLTETRVSKN